LFVFSFFLSPFPFSKSQGGYPGVLPRPLFPNIIIFSFTLGRDAIRVPYRLIAGIEKYYGVICSHSGPEGGGLAKAEFVLESG